MAFDTTRLLNQVNIKGSLPEGRFTNEEILDLAYDCLLSEIVPMVLEAREEFLVTYVDLPIVAGQAEYSIPSRALNGVLREVKIIAGTSIINVERKNLEDLTDSAAGTPKYFFIAGNDVGLYPTPATTENTLRLYYFIRPSKLVPVIETARITNITGNTVSVSIPSTWTTSNTFDLVRGKAHFDILATDLIASTVAGGVITFTTNVPSKLVVGDYVTLAEETCFPFLPPEGHTALVQAAATAALESMGDPLAGQSAEKTKMLKDTFQSILKLRVQGQTTLGTRLL